jgi:hypothetical protein
MNTAAALPSDADTTDHTTVIVNTDAQETQQLQITSTSSGAETENSRSTTNVLRRILRLRVVQYLLVSAAVTTILLLANRLLGGEGSAIKSNADIVNLVEQVLNSESDLFAFVRTLTTTRKP